MVVRAAGPAVAVQAAAEAVSEIQLIQPALCMKAFQKRRLGLNPIFVDYPRPNPQVIG